MVSTQIPDPIRITYTNPEFSVKEHVLVSRKDVWHKFILYNAAAYQKTLVLDALIAVCEPNFLMPYMYNTEENGCATFLTKCCANTVQSLVMQGLTLYILPEVSINYDIILGYISTKELPVNPQFMLNNAVHNRYDLIKKTLNLDKFEDDEQLQPFYCPLSVNRVLEKVLQSAKMKGSRDTKIPIRKLSLASNRIKSIFLLEKFFTPSLVSLDLRFNNLHDITDLKYFMEYRLTELWLDGNPFCEKFTMPQDYIQTVKTFFPHLQILDGVTVNMNKNLANNQMCYLGDGNISTLIKQFLMHYYTLYDQSDRIVMQGIYDDKAFYSMTVGMLNYTPSQMMKKFTMNRNLLKFVDYSKCHEFLLRGPDKIISILRQQPPTVHNVKYMNVDVMHQNESYFVVSIQGHFIYKAIPKQPMFFSRVFIVTALEDNEYRIINDMYHLASAPAETKASKFNMKVPNFVPNALSVSEMEQLVILMNKVSTMNKIYCRNFLEKVHWDIRQAINNFIKAYTLNDIPQGAFYNSFEFQF